MNKKQLTNLLLIFGAFGLPIVILDQLTKELALAYLEVGATPVPFIGNFITLQLVFNSGAAFSLASSYTWLFSIFSLVVLIAVGIFGREVDNLYWRLCLGALAGGAVGNLIDRIIRMPGIFEGQVVDFLNYHNYFVGNLADIAIVLAACGLVILSILGVGIRNPKHRSG